MAKKIVAITGCDSGLGWALAARSAREGYISVAGMYEGVETQAANALKSLCAHTVSLDVTKRQSVEEFHNYVQKLLEENPDYHLHAVVNNAGVMPVGDYEWQTATMLENTINVNLLGTMRIISAFLPDLRRTAMKNKNNPRLINVASHCGIQPLPGFAAYSATKAGVIALTKALNIEQKLYGLLAIAFIPGGYIQSSKIMKNQQSFGDQILAGLDTEQNLVYGKRVSAMNNYLSQVVPSNNYDSMQDENIIETFMKALNDEIPKRIYKVESWRYKFYYTLMKLPLPETVHYWLIKKFVSMPDS